MDVKVENNELKKEKKKRMMKFFEEN